MNFSGNMRRNTNKMPDRGGPLMTDHLQDLELELELLKRKRQLIQRQQSEVLYNRGPADNMRYNQPSQSYNDRFNEPQHLNFSHLYNEAPRDDRSFGLKRRAEPWSSAPGDRFDNPMGANKRPRQGPFNRNMDQNNSQNFQRPRPNQPQSLMGQPKPLMNFQSQVPRRAPQPNMMAKQNQGPKPLTYHPNFKRNKQPGPNPRPGFTPNKINAPFKKTGPVKKFNSTSPNVKNEKKTPVLSADKQPSCKTIGRLELALGMIVKEIKLTYGNNPEYAGIFASMPLARMMKEGIRERVRSVMDGKTVGIVSDIVAEYRQKYPLETDKEIVDLAMVEKQKTEQKSELAIKLLEEGDPEEFFKKNMNKLLDARFGEMLQKLEKVVRDGNNPITAEILKNLPDVKKTPEGDEKGAAGEATANEEAAEKTADMTPSDTASKEKNYLNWLSLFLERKLPSLLSRNRKAILRVFDLDLMFRNTRAAIIINTNKKAQAINRKESTNGSDQSKDDPEMPRNLPYFAKVLAHPAIPKRKLMQEFLNQFNPKTIKRHKKNFNLLFIGFNNKEDYDRILAANQTIIGNATLSIAGNVIKTTTIEIEDQNDIDQVLTPQLDDQINDLLSSIRKADEESKANEDTSTKTAEVDLTADGSSEKDEEGKVEVNSDSNGNEKPEETNDNKETEAANDTEKAKGADATETAETADDTEETDAAEGNAEDDINDDECQVVESNGKEVVTIEDDEVAPLKSDDVKQASKALATPAKGRAPATPSSIRTRRSSRLGPN